MNKLIKLLVVGFVLFTLGTSVVKAEEETCVAVTQYGGSVSYVCGAKHETVDTGLADINPLVLASIFFVLAGSSFIKAKRLSRAEVAL